MFDFFTRMAAETTDKLIDLSPLPDTPADATTLETILSVIFATLGAVAVLVITFGGFMYVLSHGDAKVIAQAKNTILYAVIGLVVSISGFAIVNFFIGNML